MCESSRKYVSSRGLGKSCKFNPFINEKKLDITKINNEKNPTIYVKTINLKNFINNILPNICYPFVLISGDNDDRVPNDIFDKENFLKFINNPLIKHWYCQNFESKHEKVTNLPIGLDYHTLTSRPLWGPIKSCKDQEVELESIIKLSKPFYERKIKCYGNFHFCKHTRISNERHDIPNIIPNELIDYEISPMPPRKKSWENQINYSFIISPPGNGRDCHRTWEGLILGCIVILKTSPMDDLFQDLPVLIINEWTDVNMELLTNTVNEFKNKKFNYDKLLLNYWKEKFNTHD